MQDLTNKVNGEKQAIKAAKKEIRKGKKTSGASVRAKVQDEFGRVHGYDSDASKKLDASKLVQRKHKQERKASTKAQPSAQRGAAKDWAGTTKFGEYGDASETFTLREGRQINRQQQKKFKAGDKKTTKASKARAKQTRKHYRNT